MDTLIQHPVVGTVVVRRSPRARQVTLSVRLSGEVRLTLPFAVGIEQALAFLDRKTAWVVRAQQRLAERQATAPPPPDRDQIEKLLQAAKNDLPTRLARLAAATGLRYTHLTITSARTKWGSCSSRNRISLSLFLMALPERLRDFVLLHELCHTVHHNHSAAFHALLDHLCCGREKELNRELRSFRIG